jgi:anti-anti-sigma factor
MDITAMADDVGVRRLRIRGRIVQNSLGEQWSALDRLLNPGEPPRPLLLDLAEADFIDSSGLSFLLMWHKRYCTAGTKFVMHSIQPMVFDVLRTMRLDSVFHIAADEGAGRQMIEGAVG